MVSDNYATPCALAGAVLCPVCWKPVTGIPTSSKSRIVLSDDGLWRADHWPHDRDAVMQPCYCPVDRPQRRLALDVALGSAQWSTPA